MLQRIQEFIHEAGVVPEYKIPLSVLVVIHTSARDVLLLRRVDAPDAWQSVTGSRDNPDEPWLATAEREVAEETGIDCRAPWHTLTDWGLENVYAIYPEWRHRYAPGTFTNTERVLGLRLPRRVPVRLSPAEHTDCMWLPWREAALRVQSASNAEAILLLPRFCP